MLSRPVRLVKSSDGTEGVHRVELIAAGEYKVDDWWTFIIPESVLTQAIELFNLSPSYVHSGGQHVSPYRYSEADKVGWYSDITMDDGIMLADANIVDTTRGSDYLKLLAATKKNKNLCQLSASFYSDDEVWYDSEKDMVYQKLTKITDVISVDFVNRGFCDTGVRQLSQDGGLNLNPRKLAKFLAEKNITDEKLIALINTFASSVEDEDAVKQFVKNLLQASGTADPTPAPSTETPPAPAPAPAPAADEVNVDEIIGEHELSDAQAGIIRQFADASNDKDAIRKFVTDLIASNVVEDNDVDIDQLCKDLNLTSDASIQLVKSYGESVGLTSEKLISSFATKLRKNLADNFNANKKVEGQTVTVTRDVATKHQLAMQGFFLGEDVDKQAAFVDPMQSYVEMEKPDANAAYRLTANDLWNELNKPIFQLAISGTTGWAAVLDDSLHKVSLQMFEDHDLQRYKQLIHRVIPAKDFLEHNASLPGGYGELVKVGEGDLVPNLTSADAFDSSITVENFSGLESVTWQQFMNDHIGILKALPMAISTSGVRTIFNAVTNHVKSKTIKTNEADTAAVVYSATNLNLGSVKLSVDNMITVDSAMKKHSMYGQSSNRVGAQNSAKYLIVPTDLEVTANRIAGVAGFTPLLAQDSDSTDAASIINAFNNNPFAGKVEPFVAENWTDANNWVAMADPKKRPGIIMSFLNGDKPDIARSHGETSESDFTKFTMRWRVAIQFAIASVDFRCFYLNEVAD